MIIGICFTIAFVLLLLLIVKVMRELIKHEFDNKALNELKAQWADIPRIDTVDLHVKDVNGTYFLVSVSFDELPALGEILILDNVLTRKLKCDLVIEKRNIYDIYGDGTMSVKFYDIEEIEK